MSSTSRRWSGNPNTFLYNTGPIDSISSPNWNRKQFYSVTRSTHRDSRVLASKVPCPPCNIGPASTPNYESLAAEAVYSLGGGRTVFAGQRLEGFYIDLGAIFDLGDLRPFEKLHIGGMANSLGVNATHDFSVHSIALQVPKGDLSRHRWESPGPNSRGAVIGVWAAASRSKATIREPAGVTGGFGPPVQVSRLGNPLFNEVIVPMGKKDLWNSLTPAQDREFLHYVQHPELAGLLPTLYPGVFPNLAKLTAARADLVAVLLTGIPSGLIAGFQNYTGTTYADELRLNMAIPPSSHPNALGVIGGDLAGFPNGRRVFDDVTSVELRAIAGATYPARRQELQARPGGVPVDRRARREQHQLPVRIPVSRPPAERLSDRAAVNGELIMGTKNGVTADTDRRPSPPPSASVALDIGEGRGALVIYPDERYRGREIEISATDSDGHRVHTGVHDRATESGAVLTAIFGSLPAGEYVIWTDATTEGPIVTVPEAAVAEVNLH